MRLLSIGLVLLSVGIAMLAGTYSAFTATDSDSGTVTAGNLEIRLGLFAGVNELQLNDVDCPQLDNMAPGDVCIAFIQVRNDGSLPLTYIVEAVVVPVGCFNVTWVGPTDITNGGDGNTPGSMPAGAGDVESLKVFVEVEDSNLCQGAEAEAGVKVNATS